MEFRESVYFLAVVCRCEPIRCVGKKIGYFRIIGINREKITVPILVPKRIIASTAISNCKLKEGQFPRCTPNLNIEVLEEYRFYQDPSI